MARSRKEGKSKKGRKMMKGGEAVPIELFIVNDEKKVVNGWFTPASLGGMPFIGAPAALKKIGETDVTGIVSTFTEPTKEKAGSLKLKTINNIPMPQGFIADADKEYNCYLTKDEANTAVTPPPAVNPPPDAGTPPAAGTPPPAGPAPATQVEGGKRKSKKSTKKSKKSKKSKSQKKSKK